MTEVYERIEGIYHGQIRVEQYTTSTYTCSSCDFSQSISVQQLQGETVDEAISRTKAEMDRIHKPFCTGRN